MTQMNIYRKVLQECSCEPKTGWFRDGSCATDDNDKGRHVVCCEMTEDFLAFSKYVGNDLSTPMPDFGFPGLKPGDHWCVCLERWKQAYEAGCAPLVNMEATHLSALELVSIEDLESCKIQPSTARG
ncbi:DUF2237 family protein [Pseudobacteriovorax antillogorgiicola]|uniref:DUF2237 domain-containing protein n=1 Tax=Pseudobacteriovorax antillogorgiicola TaxID=1513793 RepID=A0A1Y6BKR5_9BACT|nr:DUF2237 domain-containing protein [Pseudobacteriovorax antillogorgiicola]TCS54666.1 hypothetical protein EDD56_106179 [Pseudobacteriovorax antillogorgiicola]SMF16754.1 hypothetical protein SAMN06296036_10664 [Pseudobacteriovorax antillogorgiicola]